MAQLPNAHPNRVSPPVAINIDVIGTLVRAILARLLHVVLPDGGDRATLVKEVGDMIEFALTQQFIQMRQDPRMTNAQIDGTLTRAEAQAKAMLHGACNVLAGVQVYGGNGTGPNLKIAEC